MLWRFETVGYVNSHSKQLLHQNVDVIAYVVCFLNWPLIPVAFFKISVPIRFKALITSVDTSRKETESITVGSILRHRILQPHMLAKPGYTEWYAILLRKSDIACLNWFFTNTLSYIRWSRCKTCKWWLLSLILNIITCRYFLNSGSFSRSILVLPLSCMSIQWTPGAECKDSLF